MINHCEASRATGTRRIRRPAAATVRIEPRRSHPCCLKAMNASRSTGEGSTMSSRSADADQAQIAWGHENGRMMTPAVARAEITQIAVIGFRAYPNIRNVLPQGRGASRSMKFCSPGAQEIGREPANARL
jgi:hypothetical protein